MTKTIAPPSRLRALGLAFSLLRVAIRWGARAGVVAAAGLGVRQALARRKKAEGGSSGSDWPGLSGNSVQGLLTNAPVTGPTTDAADVAAPSERADSGPVADAGPRWIDPVDGGCPDSHPVKANADSGIYHVVGGMSYDRTIAERCYCNETDAEADGFRRAKR